MKEELQTLDATALARLIADGELCAREVLEATIARIEALEPTLGALASESFEVARARAAGPLKGPFAGVPFLIKDLLAYPGTATGFGTRVFEGAPSQGGSPLTEAFDRAGLVVVGKSATSEMGLLGSTETLAGGVTRNPWAPGISAMGSSGGAAAAVAAGLVPIAHASDGGGSIRIPASAQGLFGFLPGQGVVASNGQAMPVDLLREHCLSRSVRDSARMLACIEAEPGRVGFVPGPSSERLRVGVYRETLLGQRPDPSVDAALTRAAGLCEDLGHAVEAAPPPPVDGAALSRAFFVISGAMVGQMMEMAGQMLGRPLGAEDLEPFTLELVAWQQSLPASSLPDALGTCAQLGAQMRAYLEGYDVVLCPTMPVEPWSLGTLAPDLGRETLIERTERLAGYTAVHNPAGGPAMSVPLAQGPTGLPIGMHFATAPGGERRLLALAYALESAAPWAGRWPPSVGGAAQPA